jgi:hypothetical protein
MRWTAIGRGFFCPVAVCPARERITLFARGATGELFFKEWQGTEWSEFHSLGIPIAHLDSSQELVPADWLFTACSGGPDRIDLFAGSPDGELLHMTRAGSQWGAFECLGGPATMKGSVSIPLGLAGPPAACSGRPERIDVFVAGQSGELLHTSWNAGAWSEFESLGAPTVEIAKIQQLLPLSGSLGACSCGADRMGVFIRGPLGDLKLKWWDGTTWSEFASLGWPQVLDEVYPAVTVPAPLTGPPAACSWGPDRMDVFARGPDSDMLHKRWDGRVWSPFESLGMPTTSGPEPRCIPFTGAVTACSWGANRVDVFARALDGNLHHAWWDGSWDHD